VHRLHAPVAQPQGLPGHIPARLRFIEGLQHYF
jgi:hypothetical protein